MDVRLSCLIWGITGVIFGLLALLFPELLLVTFYGIFLLLAGLAIAIFLFLAITSRSEDSVFWFGISAAILVVIVLSFIVQLVVQIIFLLIIAGIALYNGFTDITLALTYPKTKYILIPGMIIAGVILLAAILWYFPAMYDDFTKLIVVILGNFAFVFGLVSIMMGLYQKEDTGPDLQEGKWISKDKACQIPEPERKK
jgi:uncharacterized membrane protein HdeD (DUF308 family)